MSGDIEEEEELPPRGFVDPRARLPKEILDELEAEEAEEAAREAARAAAEAAEEPLNPQDVEIRFEDYHDEDTQIQVIMDLVDNELSEPYNIFTYRYFVNNWPNLTFLAWHGDKCVGVIICKLDHHKSGTYRGYVAMLVVLKRYRKLGLGRELVRRCLTVMQREGADECVLEVEYNNEGALRLYQSLGFIRDKRLEKYYLNGHDAFRMKLRFKKPCPWHEPQEDDGIFQAGLEFLEKEKEKTRRLMEDKSELAEAIRNMDLGKEDVGEEDQTLGLGLWRDGPLWLQYPGKYDPPKPEESSSSPS